MEELSTKKCYPCDVKGNMLECQYGRTDHWKPIEEFIAELCFSHYEKGRSSLRFILVNPENNTSWSMMAQSIDLFVGNSNNGRLIGKWIVKKQGANYGLVLLEVLC